MSGLAWPKPVRAEKRRPERKRKPPRRLQTEASDRQFLAHVHQAEPCVGVREFPNHRCRGGGQASHYRNHTGIGRKEPDRMAIKMCADLHLNQWERYAGVFKGWTQLDRKEWFLARVWETQGNFVQAHPERAADFPGVHPGKLGVSL